MSIARFVDLAPLRPGVVVEFPAVCIIVVFEYLDILLQSSTNPMK